MRKDKNSIKVWDNTKIRPIPGIANHFLTRNGFVFDAERNSVYGSITPGYLECRVPFEINGPNRGRIVYLQADETYERVWGEKPPKDVWLNRIGKRKKRMSVLQAIDMDLWKGLQLCDPRSNGDTYYLKSVNDLLIDLLKKHKIDYKNEIKKMRENA